MDETGALKAAGAALALAVLWLVEGALPMFEGRERRARHGARNLALGLANAGVTALIFAGATLVVTEGARERGFGLLHLLELPDIARIPLAIVAFDAWQYLWHRLNHRIPLLWRFHSVHHSDAELDATSGLRFHTGEIVLSSLARLAVLPLLGLTVMEVLIYEAILLPIILFHHSNVRLPGAVDRWLRWLIVTPWMHWVHHSDRQPETDSNYSSIFSFWDRLFGSFRLRADPGEIRLGLSYLDRSEWDTLRGMLALPFRRREGAARRDAGPRDGDGGAGGGRRDGPGRRGAGGGAGRPGGEFGAQDGGQRGNRRQGDGRRSGEPVAGGAVRRGAGGGTGVALTIALLLAGCGGDGKPLPPDPTGGPDPVPAPVDLSLGWATSTAEAEGFDALRLEEAFAGAEGAVPNLRSLVVIRNGRLVREAYFGEDARPDTPFDMRSVTKTVTALLVGIAADRGLLDPGDRMVDRLAHPSLRAEHEAIRLRDLLTMTSGIRWSDEEHFGPWVRSERPVGYVLDLPVEGTPGERFEYNTGGSHLIAALLDRAVEGSALEFARHELFGPLGIDDWRWPLMQDSVIVGGAALGLRARDAARIGQLLLQGGMSGGRRVVSGEWVEAQTSRRVSLGGIGAVLRDAGYGYQTWHDRMGGGGESSAFVMWGYGGQFVWVVPDRQLVIVTQAQWRGVRDYDHSQAGPVVQHVVRPILAAAHPIAR